MAYTKQTWATGDVITAQKLNHMEDGIANAGGYDFVLTGVQSSLTADGLSVDEMMQKGSVALKACFTKDGMAYEAIVKSANASEGILYFEFFVNEATVNFYLNTDGTAAYNTSVLNYTYADGHYVFTQGGGGSH